MKGSEIVRELKMQPDTHQCFIKWWRKENDFADYELVDTFMLSGVDELEFDGYELLDIDQMWALLRSQTSGHVDVAQKAGEKMLVWRRPDGITESLKFSPKALMEVFDAETRGDVLM
mgnify:CR=1 FL=1